MCVLKFLPTQNARLRLRATSSARGHRAGTRRVHFPPFTRRGCLRSSRSLRLATRSICCCFAVQPRSSCRPPPDFSNPSFPLKNHSPRLTSFPELRPNTSRFPPPPTHAKRRRNTSGCEESEGSQPSAAVCPRTHAGVVRPRRCLAFVTPASPGWVLRSRG